MKKDIYIIKNSVNNKVYIGQAQDAAKRWLQHIYDARYENKKGIHKQVIHKAISKYGYDKFHYEILESQIENYDEREKYWIQKYDSIVPNGYNIAPGGSGMGCDLECVSSLIKDEDTLLKIIGEISSSNKTFSNIAKKYNVGEEVISAINNGKRYKRDNFKYPLRNTKYTNELIKQIRYSIKYEKDLTFEQIAKLYSVDYSQISLINQGKIYYINGEEYPLRKKRKQDLDNDIVDKIISDIINSDLCMSDIAKKYNVSPTRISGINQGTFYQKENIVYPLRKEGDIRNKGRKNFIDRNFLLKIHDLLRQGISIKKIAENNNISPTTVCNINNGKIKKYIIDGVKYPIRPIK